MTNRTKEEITEELKEKQARYSVVENNENIDEYDKALDEQGDIKIGSLTYSPSYVLKNVDEIAYGCGLNDYNDWEMSDVQDDIDDLKQELKDLEDKEAV